MRRSQTATEYLVLTAIVIILAIIVVSILSNYSSLGDSTDSLSNEVHKNQVLSLSDPVISPQYLRFNLRNAQDRPLRIENISVGDYTCDYLVEMILLLSSRESEIQCHGFSTAFTDERIWDVNVTYVDTKLGATYNVVYDKVIFAIAEALPQTKSIEVGTNDPIFFALGGLTLADLELHTYSEFQQSLGGSPDRIWVYSKTNTSIISQYFNSSLSGAWRNINSIGGPDYEGSAISIPSFFRFTSGAPYFILPFSSNYLYCGSLSLYPSGTPCWEYFFSLL